MDFTCETSNLESESQPNYQDLGPVNIFSLIGAPTPGEAESPTGLIGGKGQLTRNGCKRKRYQDHWCALWHTHMEKWGTSTSDHQWFVKTLVSSCDIFCLLWLSHSPHGWENMVCERSAKLFVTSGDVLTFDVLIQSIRDLVEKNTCLHDCLHGLQMHRT